MKTKFEGILTNEDKDIIVSTLGVINLSEKQKINLVESVMTAIYKYSDYFTILDLRQKVEALTIMALVFDTFLDAEINPLARQYFLKGFNYFNNNILDDIAGGACHV
jgi:hypothetical protein